MFWEFVEGLTGKKREEIKETARIVATRVISGFVCHCGHLRQCHHSGDGKCYYHSATGGHCDCAAFQPKSQ